MRHGDTKRMPRSTSVAALRTGARWLAACAALALPLGAGFAQAAAAACDPAPARATSVQGNVEAKRAGDSRWTAVKLNDTFCPGDVIRVQEHSRADVMLLDQSVLRLNANASITVEAPKERKGVIDLLRGAVHFFSRGPNSLDVNTPFTVAGVRGTEFLITVEPQRTLVTVFEGTVVAQNPSGSLTLGHGQSAMAEAGKPPVPRVVLHPRDAVQWALYYPPVVYSESPAGAGSARAHVYRAQRLLAVGSVDEARAEIDRALQLAPGDANAASLQAIMTLVQGDKDRAFAIAQAAVSAAPNSATAQIALSYAQQARFDLSGARASVQRAVEIEPRNALAWARLAELDSSFSELDKARADAEKAVELQPDLSRTQTVLGFAQLTSVKIKEAKQSFEKAIALDQADPLPRLGLGLAKFRDGELDAGSREMEIAASLDPGSAVVRSYLGKAYFEEKRSPRDEREFGVAKQLDPKDPTPWFYDAIAKQTTNRPVEALEDMGKAVELNKNRAVYRSSLQLDSDLAARSASLGRIYSDLGFQEAALVEGWTSATADPTSFSAARLLADSYAALPRHEVARVSELLRSQLLQPINITPIQPTLAVSNLFLVSSLGPAATSFNEFNSLMVNRDRVTVSASGLVGENSTSGGEVVAAGIDKRLSYSLGYSKFDTDGWRTNANQRDENHNAFLQMEVSPQTSVQFEYRYRDLLRGDLQQRFWNDNFEAHYQDENITKTFRIGGRHDISPNSTLLLNYTKLESGERETFAPPNTPPVDVGLGVPVPLSFQEIDGSKNKQRGSTTELQYILRSPRFDLVTGAGYVRQEGTPRLQIGVDVSAFFGPGFENFIVVDQLLDLTVDHYNVYAYGYLKPAENLTLIGGVSYDHVEGGAFYVPGPDPANTVTSTNPKFGVIYRPLPGTTIRAAAFKNLKRTLLNDQTLEPTQVAGFNQFYDDFNATEAWRYGLAVNQKFTNTLFGGVEGSYRKLDTPAVDILNLGQTFTNHGKEYQGLAYLLYAPRPWLALRGGYSYDKFENDLVAATVFPPKLRSQRVPLSIGVFHPSGLLANVTTTYWNQKGEFTELATQTTAPGQDAFWVTDLALGYRLPNRRGMITAGVKNVFDRDFNYFNTDPRNPLLTPGRMAFVKLTLALP